MNIENAQKNIDNLIQAQGVHLDDEQDGHNTDSHLNLDRSNTFDEEDFELTRIFPGRHPYSVSTLAPSFDVDEMIKGVVRECGTFTDTCIETFTYYGKQSVDAFKKFIQTYNTQVHQNAGTNTNAYTTTLKPCNQKTTQIHVTEIDSFVAVIPIHYTKQKEEVHTSEHETTRKASLFQMSSFVIGLVFKNIFYARRGVVIDNKKNYCFTNQ